MLLLFIIITTLLILLPLIPAFIELALATDIEPLKLVQDYDTSTQYFAQGLLSYLEKNFTTFFSAPAASNSKFQEGKLRDGTPFQIAGSDERLYFSKKETEKKKVSRLVISSYPLLLPSGMFFEKEIYGRAAIKAEAGSQFRAMMAEGDIDLGDDTTILRWVHSNASLYVGDNASLYGRASAAGSITITGNSRFERLSAPRIIFGQSGAAPQPLYHNDQLVRIDKLTHVKEQFERRWLIEGDIHIKENSLFDGDLIATRSVQIESGSHITGSLKSNKDMYISSRVRIDGSLVSTGYIHIEPGCQIMGPVISENVIFIENDVIIGTPQLPTSVVAPRINVIGHVLVYGNMRVEIEGRSILESSPEVNV